jgi:hypothetical protein
MKILSNIRASIILVGLSFLLGCGGSSSTFSLMADSQSFVAENVSFNNKVDILFVINSEPSMSSFQAKLVASFGSFMQIFSTKGFDYRVAVVTASAYMADPTLAAYSSANLDFADFNDYNGSTYSGVHVLVPETPNLFDVFAINARPTKNPAGQDGRAFSSFRQALQSTRPINVGFMRPDAFLAVVIVDNQDDFSGNARCTGCNVSARYTATTLDTVDTYIDFLNTVTGTSGATARYNVSAMTQIAAPCQGGSNMVRIMDLATRTNGILGDICQVDFGAPMAEISDKIATLSTQFFLDRLPIVSTITVKVGGVSVTKSQSNGWWYNSDVNSITFHGSAVPSQGAVIEVDFDPQAYGS